MLSPTPRDGSKGYATRRKIRAVRRKSKMGVVELGRRLRPRCSPESTEESCL